MASTIWSDIHINFKNLLEDSSTGVGSLTNVNNTYSEAIDSIDLGNQPNSVFNGKFSIQLNGINRINEDIATGVIDYEYDVKLQLGYIFYNNVSKASYNNAIIDVEEIIRKRLDVTTFANSTIENIIFLSVSPFKFISVGDSEEHATIDLFFQVYGRSDIGNS